MSKTNEKIVRIIAEQLGIDENIVAPEKSLTADLSMDSLDDIELVMAIEDEFGVEIPDDEAEACKTVQHIFDLIARRAMTPTTHSEAADARREIGKWLNEEQTKPVDRVALAQLCAGFDALARQQEVAAPVTDAELWRKHTFVRSTLKHHGISDVHTALVADLIHGLEQFADSRKQHQSHLTNAGSGGPTEREILASKGYAMLIGLPVVAVRPTDRQLLATLAKALQVSDKQTHEWLYTFDFDSVSDQLIDEERIAK